MRVILEQRYHIHICLVRNEQPELENALQIALAHDYFLSWDLIGEPSNYMDFSRQQIDRADIVLFLLGNNYGHLSPSGVSFLHLNYVYASTKKKAIFAIIKHFEKNNITYQLHDFSELIKKERPKNLIIYTNLQDAIEPCLNGIKKLTENHVKTSWLKQTKQAFHDRNELQILPKASTNPLEGLRRLPIKHINTPTSHMNIQLSTKLPKPKKLLFSDIVIINYSVQAYRDGNLTDIMLTHTFNWGEIVQFLTQLPSPFSTETMLRTTNDTLKKFALTETLKIIPNAHTVSRCQINSLDFQWIKKQLIENQWLLPVQDNRSHREIWQINPKLQENHHDG